MSTSASRRLLIVALAMISASIPARAQTAAVDSAVAAARGKLLALFRRDYLYVAQQAVPGQVRRARVTIDSLLQQDSIRMIAGTSWGILFQVDSVAKLRTWSDEEFAAKIVGFWVGMTGDNRYRGVVQLDTPGAVPVGSDTVLVTYRLIYADKLVGPYLVEQMTRCPRGWCSELPAPIPAIAAMMRMPRNP